MTKCKDDLCATEWSVVLAARPGLPHAVAVAPLEVVPVAAQVVPAGRHCLGCDRFGGVE